MSARNWATMSSMLLRLVWVYVKKTSKNYVDKKKYIKFATENE